MLDVTPEHLWSEIDEAETLNHYFLGDEYRSIRRSYAGAGYRDDWNLDRADFENFTYQWMSIYSPLVLSGNPRVKARSRKTGTAQDVSKALSFALNRNIVDNDFRGTAELLFSDWAIRWGVAMTRQERIPGQGDIDDPFYRPISYHIPLEEYLWDPVATKVSEERWRGHKIVRDKEDLLAEAVNEPEMGWNKDLVLALSEDAHIDRIGRDDAHASSIRRGEVVYVEMWVPEHQLESYTAPNGRKIKPEADKGYHGTIFTVAYGTVPTATGSDRPDAYLRPPRPFYGPPEGPYTVSGAFIVPGQTHRLSPISAVQAQVDELNSVRHSLSNRIQKHKKGWAVRGESGDRLAEAMEQFEDQQVFMVPGLDPSDDVRSMVMPVELGGVDNGDYSYFEFLRTSLERNSGLSDAALGATQSGVTATAEAIANAGSTRRSGYVALQFLKFEEAILRKEAWYLLEDNRSMVLLGPEAEEQLTDSSGEVVKRPVWSGAADDGVKVDDLEIEIDIYSVSQTSEQQEMNTSQQMLNIGLTIAPQIPQTVLWFDWEKWLEREGQRMGVPDLASYVNLDVAREVGAQMLGGAQPQPFTQAPQPRLSADIKPKGENGYASMGALLNGAAKSGFKPQPRKTDAQESFEA